MYHVFRCVYELESYGLSNYNSNYMFILRIKMYLFVVTHVIIQFCMFYVKVHVQIDWKIPSSVQLELIYSHSLDCTGVPWASLTSMVISLTLVNGLH
jgi:hypothetical protein